MRVPTYQQTVATPSPAKAPARMAVPSSGAMSAPQQAGAGLGAAIGDFGGVLAKLKAQRDIRNNNIKALALYSDYNEAVRQLTNDARSKEGVDALDIYPQYEKDLESLTKDFRGQAENVEIGYMFDEYAFRAAESGKNEIAGHQAQQEKAARDNVIGNLLTMQEENINSKPGDHAALEESLSMIGDAIDMHYPAGEATEKKNLAKYSLTKRFIYNTASIDPAAAYGYLKAWKETGEFGGKEYLSLKSEIEGIVKTQEANMIYRHIDGGGSYKDYKFTSGIGLDENAKADILAEGKRYENLIKENKTKETKVLQEKTESELLQREASGEFIPLEELNALNAPDDDGIQALSNESYKHFTKDRTKNETDYETYLDLRQKYAEGKLTSSDIMNARNKLSDTHLKQFIDDVNKQDNDLNKIKTKEWGKYIGGILSERFGNNPSEEDLARKAQILDEFYSTAKDMDPEKIEEFAKSLVVKESRSVFGEMWKMLLSGNTPTNPYNIGFAAGKRLIPGRSESVNVAQTRQAEASTEIEEEPRRRMPGEDALTYLQRQGLE